MTVQCECPEECECYPTPEQRAVLLLRADIRETIELVWRLYRLPGCSVGGPLHVVLDDANVDDHWLHIPGPPRNPITGELYEVDPYPQEAERLAEMILIRLRALPTMTERLAVTGEVYNDPERGNPWQFPHRTPN